MPLHWFHDSMIHDSEHSKANILGKTTGEDMLQFMA